MVVKMPRKKSKDAKDASDKERPSKGDALFDQVVRLTGIPGKTIKDELKVILERKNIDIDKLTLDQLRTVVASYLREIMSGLLDGTPGKKREPQH